MDYFQTDVFRTIFYYSFFSVVLRNSGYCVCFLISCVLVGEWHKSVWLKCVGGMCWRIFFAISYPSVSLNQFFRIFAHDNTIVCFYAK